MKNMTIEEIMKDSRENDNYFFAERTMRVWETKVMDEAEENMFITRDKVGELPDGSSKYNYYLRVYNPEQHRVWTVLIRDTLEEVKNEKADILAGNSPYCEKVEDFKKRGKLE